MKNLPIGGVWKGKVKLHSNSPAQDYFANITLNTLDPNHIDVFFPEFAHATPRVQLDLHPTGSVNGSNYAQDLTMLDMCLYDGFNGNAISYEIMLKDEGRPAAGRRDGYFSIYRQEGPPPTRENALITGSKCTTRKPVGKLMCAIMKIWSGTALT